MLIALGGMLSPSLIAHWNLIPFQHMLHSMGNQPKVLLRMSSACELNVMDWRQLQIAIQWIYRGTVSDQGRGHFSAPCGIAAWYLLRGEGLVRYDGGEIRGRKGDWLFPNMGPHYKDFSKYAEILSLRFHLEWPDGQPLFQNREGLVIPGIRYPHLLRQAETMERVISKGGRQIHSNVEFMDRRFGLSVYLDIETSLLQWSKNLYHAFTAEGVKPSLERFADDRVARALRVLDGWPLHRTFSQSQLIEQAGISRAQLDRLFTANLGQTPHQYFDRRRLRNAERSVQLLNRPIKEVAFDLGFRHVSSFSAWFKQKTGANPSARRTNTPSSSAIPPDYVSQPSIVY